MGAERTIAAVNPSGHIAAAFLVSRRPSSAAPRRPALAAACLGALLPDMVDKTAMLTGVTPYGRTVGHSLTLWSFTLGLALVATATAPEASRTRALTYLCAGGLSHLAVDLVDDVVEGFERSGWAFSGWLGWPHSTPDDFMIAVPHALESNPMTRSFPTSLELLFVLGTVGLIAWDARRRGLEGRAA